LVFVNNLLINEANPESNESVVSQHSGIFRCDMYMYMRPCLHEGRVTPAPQGVRNTPPSCKQGLRYAKRFSFKSYFSSNMFTDNLIIASSITAVIPVCKPVEQVLI
jgi:hypothetical protein